jgi:hypothetical protein
MTIITKRLTKLVLLLLLLSTPLIPQAQPKKVTWGVYVTSLYDFDLINNCYTIEMWWWANYKDSSVVLNGNVEILNAKELEDKFYQRITYDSVTYWETKKMKAVISNNWDINNFPFDKTDLKIRIESSVDDSTRLKVSADCKNSKLSEDIKSGMNIFTIDTFKVSNKIETYPTDYGDPTADYYSSFDGLVIDIGLSRNSLGIFIKLIIGVFIATMISLLSFMIGNGSFDTRLAIASSGLFAAIANKYVVDSQLPPTPSITLVDKIHLWSFAFIFLSMIVHVYCMSKYDEASNPIVRRIYKWSSYLCPIIYLLSIAVSVFFAIV